MTEVNERRGSSGALIDVTPATTAKYDTIRTNGRVREQGTWLHSYPFPQTPGVKRVLTNGYEMETLSPLDIFSKQPMDLVTIAYETWRQTQYPYARERHPRPQQKFCTPDKAALRRYVINICTQLNQGALGLSLLSVVEDLAVPGDMVGGTWTHGDPIVDNLMFRVIDDDTIQYVLIDPIPPTPALPSHPMVDWGRFVQSAAGYEQIRYLKEFPEDYLWQDNVNEVVNWFANREGGFDLHAARAGLLYGVIGMLRGARTAAPDQKIALCIQAQNLGEELLKWMR